jgi:hypothetical protein
MNMDNFFDNLRPGFWGVVGGAVALSVIGFNWGGWITSEKAEKMVNAAVIERLVPICVGQFNRDANKMMKLAEMKNGDVFKQGEYVVKQGWATMPGAKEADGYVAEDCATVLMSLASGSDKDQRARLTLPE